MKDKPVVFLEGGRVFLRPIEEGDAARFARWVNDPATRIYLARQEPTTMEREREWMARFGGSSADVVLAIVMKRGGLLIGNCDLHRIDWQSRNAELGVVIGERPYRGKGYGREAIALLLGHAFGTLNLHRVYLWTDSFNAPGLACYKACGFREEGRAREESFRSGAYHDKVLMGILRSEWKER